MASCAQAGSPVSSVMRRASQLDAASQADPGEAASQQDTASLAGSVEATSQAGDAEGAGHSLASSEPEQEPERSKAGLDAGHVDVPQQHAKPGQAEHRPGGDGQQCTAERAGSTDSRGKQGGIIGKIGSLFSS